MFRVEDFTGEAIHDQPTRRLWTVDRPFDARVKDLVRDWGANKNPELIEEMIVTALKMARDEMGVADLNSSIVPSKKCVMPRKFSGATRSSAKLPSLDRLAPRQMR